MLEKLRETPSSVSIKNGADMKYERSQHFRFKLLSEGTNIPSMKGSQLVETSPVGQGTDNLTERSLSVAAGCREVHN